MGKECKNNEQKRMESRRSPGSGSRDHSGTCGWRLLMNEHVAVHRGADSIYVAGTENYDKPKRTNVERRCMASDRALSC